MQENALVLLKRKLGDAEWDKVMGPYWNSLPRPEDVRTKETFPPSKLSLLQDPSMVPCRQPAKPVLTSDLLIFAKLTQHSFKVSRISVLATIFPAG